MSTFIFYLIGGLLGVFIMGWLKPEEVFIVFLKRISLMDMGYTYEDAKEIAPWPPR